MPSSNPAVKDRVNCVNAKLQNHAGQYRLLISAKCKHPIKDFERGCWKADHIHPSAPASEARARPAGNLLIGSRAVSLYVGTDSTLADSTRASGRVGSALTQAPETTGI